MLRHIAASCIFAAVLLTPQAHANCPVSPIPLEAYLTADPASTVGAGVWSFSMDGFNFPPTTLLASAGRFVTTLGTDRSGATIGILTITQTASIDGSVVRLETDTGRFHVNPGCESGTLTFNTSSRPAQFDFFVVSINEIIFVGTNNGDILSGRAVRVSGGQATPSCPANPLSTLFGTWAFEVDGFHSPQFLFLAAAGRFIATQGTAANGAPIGVLVITQTSARNGSITRLEGAGAPIITNSNGRYALNADCSGGTLTFNLGSRPAQYDFFFTNGNSSMAIVGSNNGDIVEGTATRVQ